MSWPKPGAQRVAKDVVRKEEELQKDTVAPPVPGIPGANFTKFPGDANLGKVSMKDVGGATEVYAGDCKVHTVHAADVFNFNSIRMYIRTKN